MMVKQNLISRDLLRQGYEAITKNENNTQTVFDEILKEGTLDKAHPIHLLRAGYSTKKA